MKTKRHGEGRLHARKYATLLHFLTIGHTAYQMAEAHGLQLFSAMRVCKELVTLGLAHVEAYAPGPGERWEVPVFKRGPGDNAVRRKRDGTPSKLQFPQRPVTPRSEVIAFATAVRALQRECFHGASLATEIGVQHSTALALLNHLKSLRLIYVEEWLLQSRGGAKAPMYRWGSRPDAKRPKAMPQNQLFQIYTAERTARRRAVALSMAMCGRKQLRAPFSRGASTT